MCTELLPPSGYPTAVKCIIQTQSFQFYPEESSKDLHNIKGKGKAIPLQAWTGPEGSRRLRLPDFKTIGT